jgi:phosphate-selective porin OprO/OprP
MASLIWIPTDYVRFLVNYARLSYDDAAIPALGGDRDYGVDVLGARAQIDF